MSERCVKHYMCDEEDIYEGIVRGTKTKILGYYTKQMSVSFDGKITEESIIIDKDGCLFFVDEDTVKKVEKK